MGVKVDFLSYPRCQYPIEGLICKAKNSVVSWLPIFGCLFRLLFLLQSPFCNLVRALRLSSFLSRTFINESHFFTQHQPEPLSLFLFFVYFFVFRFVLTRRFPFQRGKFQANMVNLIQMNTPRVVMTETKKAFRNIFKRGSIESAAQALCNLKGVGPTMASGTFIGV